MNNCIFCKIVAGELSADVVFDDDNFLAFRDIHPKANTHLLIVPKVHIETLNDVEVDHVEILGKMLLLPKKLALDMNLSGYRLQINVGKSGGQEIFHLHLHLMSNSSA